MKFLAGHWLDNQTWQAEWIGGDCSIGESAARKPSFSLAAVCDAKFHCSVAHQNFPLLATGLCWFTLLESGLYVCITEIMGKAPCTEWQLFTDIGTVHAQLVANYTDNRHASYTTYTASKCSVGYVPKVRQSLNLNVVWS